MRAVKERTRQHYNSWRSDSPIPRMPTRLLLAAAAALLILRLPSLVQPMGPDQGLYAYVGERIKILAIYDPTAKEREKIDTLRAEQFEDATA